MTDYKNPIPTVDAFILLLDHPEKVVLVKRKNPPEGYALPGGFVNEGESYEDAVRREAKEETGLDITVHHQFHTYSDPKRDPRKHITTTVYLCSAHGTPKAGDDAAEVVMWDPEKEYDKYPLAFDHKQIIDDIRLFVLEGNKPGDKNLYAD